MGATRKETAKEVETHKGGKKGTSVSVARRKIQTADIMRCLANKELSKRVEEDDDGDDDEGSRVQAQASPASRPGVFYSLSEA